VTTSGYAGAAVRPERTLTLALLKTGLAHVPGELYVADIGIPVGVYERLGIQAGPLFADRYSMRVFACD
jgi:NAD(P)H-hydrate epimerase